MLGVCFHSNKRRCHRQTTRKLHHLQHGIKLRESYWQNARMYIVRTGTALAHSVGLANRTGAQAKTLARDVSSRTTSNRNTTAVTRITIIINLRHLREGPVRKTGQA